MSCGNCAWSGILDLSSFEEPAYISRVGATGCSGIAYEMRFSMEDSNGAALSDFKKTLRFGA